MHELYIAQSIITAVKKSLPAGIEPARVTGVRVEVGQLDAIIPETLTFLFDAIKADGGLAAAALAVTQIPVACTCRDCAHDFSMDLPVFICPACGSGNVALVSGRGLLLTGITVTDNEES